MIRSTARSGPSGPGTTTNPGTAGLTPAPPPAPHGIAPERGRDHTPRSSTDHGRFGRLFRTAPVFEVPRAELLELGARMVAPAAPELPEDLPDPADNTGDSRGLHVPRPVHRPRHHVRPGLLAAAPARPRRAGRTSARRGSTSTPSTAAGPPTSRTCTTTRTRELRLGTLLVDTGPDGARPAAQRPGVALIGDPRNDENLIVASSTPSSCASTTRSSTECGPRRRSRPASVLARGPAPRALALPVGDRQRLPAAHVRRGRHARRAPSRRVRRHHRLGTRPRPAAPDGPRPPGEQHHRGRPPAAALLPLRPRTVHPHRVLRRGVPVRPCDGPPELLHQRHHPSAHERPAHPAVQRQPRNPLANLNGHRPLPPQWGIDWKLFFRTSGEPHRPQPSHRIDDRLVAPLGQLRGTTGPP